MPRIITIVAGADTDLDGDLPPVLGRLAGAGLIFPFAEKEIARPVVELDGMEVQCEPANFEAACQMIEAAGFQVVGQGDA